MRLSASFNFFDGGELLVPALRSLRPQVEHISVIHQDVSNYGNEVSAVSKRALAEAVSLGLVDTVRRYAPDLDMGGSVNEFRKRAMGVACAREAGADHVMFCDVDEFYDPAEFAAARRFMVENRVDFSTVTYLHYYGRPTWRLVVAEEGTADPFRVAFICRLEERTSHAHIGCGIL